MKTLLCIILMCSFFNIYAQTDAIEAEINEQVWIPFMKAYNNYDALGFMNLHSRDLMRVPVDAQRIFTFEEYRNNIQQSNEMNFRKHKKQSIELRFENRIHNTESAFEIGYYKVTSTDANEKTTAFYGKFTVVLHKINNRWKITLDSDTSKNIDEATFLSGKKL
ncbi:YybH family protein [Emticicia sp. 17c]|uniref:YybH family protein n=1 Tax=Emticicia sp. 17c TaxID=3127704 RepID=UPI00301C6068